MKKTLNDTKPLENLNSDYFVRMMLPDAEKKVEHYVEEERKCLLNILKKSTYLSYNFVVVGSGTLWYVDDVYEYIKKYIAVEPLADIFIHKQVMFLIKKLNKIFVIKKEFGDFSKNLLENTNSIFVFHFNILSYITNPIEKINKYLKQGDILYISSWSDTVEARSVRKEYFNFINTGITNNSEKVDPNSEIGLCNLDLFDFKKLKFYKKHQRIKGKITDILIIYT